ncbi:MAG: hypothetical protein AMJ90_06850 [candidate division Zixibacteria bacterium SM23_73_2]|nr:MAG: hypothetical protein AMJ90_06850 [candidate division Zixibacteria bacterium SM23_73_2]
MLTERDISIVRQACIKAATNLVGETVEFMEPEQRKTILKNRGTISKFVIDIANEFEKNINKGLTVTKEDGTIEQAQPGSTPTVECINLKITRGNEKGGEKCSTWPYRDKLEELGFVWNPDYRGYTGQLTKEQWEKLKNSNEIIEIKLGKGERQRKVKYTWGTILNDLLKVEEENGGKK